MALNFESEFLGSLGNWPDNLTFRKEETPFSQDSYFVILVLYFSKISYMDIFVGDVEWYHR